MLFKHKQTRFLQHTHNTKKQSIILMSKFMLTEKEKKKTQFYVMYLEKKSNQLTETCKPIFPLSYY